MRTLAPIALAAALMASTTGSAHAFFGFLFQPVSRLRLPDRARRQHPGGPSRARSSPSAAMPRHDRGLDRERRLYSCSRAAARSATASASAAPGSMVGRQDRRPQGGVAGLDAAGRRCCAAAPTCRATWRAAWTTRSAPARCISAAPLSHPRLERAGHDRAGGLVGLHPHDQRGRGRPLRPRPGRHHGRGPALDRRPRRLPRRRLLRATGAASPPPPRFAACGAAGFRQTLRHVFERRDGGCAR